MSSRSRDAREGSAQRSRPLIPRGLRALAGILAAAVLASACTAMTPPYRGRDFRPTLPAQARPAVENKGGLYQEGHALLLFEDAKARTVGDTITVILRERTDATKSSNAQCGATCTQTWRKVATAPVDLDGATQRMPCLLVGVRDER